MKNSDFWRISSAAGSLLMIAAWQTGAYAATSDPEAKRHVHSAMDDYLGGISLRVAIHPSTPSQGIPTGLVIAYGHLIRPPYQFEYRDKRLYVNDVQVEPSIVEQRRAEKLQAFTEESKVKMQSSTDVRQHLIKLLGEGRPRDEIMQFVETHKDVIEHARWADDDSMLVKFSGGTYEVVGKFKLGKGPDEESSSPEIPDEATIKQKRLNEIQSILERGKCIVFLSSGGTYRTGDIRRVVVEVMTKDGLSQEQRIEKLKGIFPGSETPAYDILENFDASEWFLDPIP